MALKKDKAKKKKPRAKKRMSGLVVLDGKRQINRRTGMNRDIPMGHGGGSPNLMSVLATRAPTGQGGYTIQTPDQFKQAQDISTIAEEVKKQRINIGQPVELGKVQDLTNVEALKKSPVKPEPTGAGAGPPMALRPQTEEQQKPQKASSTPLKPATSKKASSAPSTPMQSQSKGASPAKSGINETSLPQFVNSYGNERAYLAGGGYGAGIRNIFGYARYGPETASLPSASAPSSLMGAEVDVGSPQGR